MLPFTKIICPTDFSEPSLDGLKAAEELALNFDAELILINVVSLLHTPAYTVPSASQFEGILEELQVAARQKLDDIINEKLSSEVKIRALVMLGNAADEITRVAEDENADVIVIATHGWTGWRRFMFGSVVEKVIRMSGCPVLTICRKKEG